MSVKITKTGVGNEDESLLFEFKDFELPEKIDYTYKTVLNTSKFINLQSSQINGTFLEPITFSGEFIGGYVDPVDGWIDAKQRASQLERLQGRIVKLFIDNIKTIAIINSLTINIYNYAKVGYSITFQPEDITNPIKPSSENALTVNETSLINANISLGKGGLNGEKTVTPPPPPQPFKDIDTSTTPPDVKIPVKEILENPKPIEDDIMKNRLNNAK